MRSVAILEAEVATGVGRGRVLLGGGCGVTLEGGWRAPSKEENCSGDRELGL